MILGVRVGQLDARAVIGWRSFVQLVPEIIYVVVADADAADAVVAINCFCFGCFCFAVGVFVVAVVVAIGVVAVAGVVVGCLIVAELVGMDHVLSSILLLTVR